MAIVFDTTVKSYSYIDCGTRTERPSEGNVSQMQKFAAAPGHAETGQRLSKIPETVYRRQPSQI
ncbi:hypothetical protein [Kamptonema formosum]|uniref:hypothetical protein n=1 Tax=Kamptonema formosum TaxID=331992 RepID=UPI00034D4989|nr:hypothetical protein [Oscillatoria sp. PCC 10802]